MAALIFLMMAVAFLVWSVEVPYDNTDPAGGRSNMMLHTDCLTGLQYLSAPRGGITPRMGVDGKQIADKSECGS